MSPLPANAIIQPELAPMEESIREPKRPAPLKTATEQVLAMITSVPPGVQMPPMPDLSGMESDYIRATSNTLEIFDTDSADLTQRIETVAWAKVELADLVKQGWKPGEVLNEIVRQHNEEASLRRTAALALKKMVDEGEFGISVLNDELQLINQELADRGLPDITLQELGLSNE